MIQRNSVADLKSVTSVRPRQSSMPRPTLLCCFEGFSLPLRGADHFIVKELATYALESGKSSVYHIQLEETLWFALPHWLRAEFRSATDHGHKLGFSSGGTVSLWHLETLLSFQAQHYKLATFGEPQARFLRELVGEDVVDLGEVVCAQEVVVNCGARAHCGYRPHKNPLHVSCVRMWPMCPRSKFTCFRHAAP